MYTMEILQRYIYLTQCEGNLRQKSGLSEQSNHLVYTIQGAKVTGSWGN